MIENILFYIVFLAQIILLSFYYPAKISTRFRQIFETYPPDKYPKLYPKSDEYYTKWEFRYRIINIIILFLGFIILFVIGFNDYHGKETQSNIIPVVYFMIQNFPLLLMEISGFSYFKLMKKADTRTVRETKLQPRRLFDFISPSIVGLAIFANVASILFFFSLEQFQFSIVGDTSIILLSLLASNGLYAGIIYWNLYGKKLDPYQDSKDRIQQIEATIKSLVFMSIAACVFLITTKSIKEFDLGNFQHVIMSLYLQIIVVMGLGSMLKKLRIENVNFDVYKVEISEDSNEKNIYRNIEDNSSSKRIIIGLCVGLIIGLAFGTLIILEGGTIKGFVLPVIFGTALGTIAGGYFELKNNNN
ncbi:MAG: hypothetical protein JEY94_17410 [Melioribacteraceae bacterium]|nr:hypothetical protein [Melioribacteraceae bacterium]